MYFKLSESCLRTNSKLPSYYKLLMRQLIYSNLYESCLRTSLEMPSLKYLYDNYRVLNSDYWLKMTWILFRLNVCISISLLLNKLSE